MFSIFRRSDKVRGHIGIHRTDDGFAIAQVLAAAGDGRPTLAHCTYEPAAEVDTLAHAVKHLSNRKLPTVSVLPPSTYHMLLVEAPAVPDEELRAAVRWRIKDLIDFHVDDAVIDVFQMPAQGRGGPNQMMYAIAARAELLKQEIADLEEAGLELEVIDVLELCLRNVAALLEEDGRGVALLYLADSTGILLLIRQGILYLTRRIETGTETLRQANGLRTSLMASLALETRRSLDYFESHYEQNAMPVLYTCGLDPADQDLLKTELGISIRNVHLAGALDTKLELDDETQRRCLPAIGAALRIDKVAL